MNLESKEGSEQANNNGENVHDIADFRSASPRTRYSASEGGARISELIAGEASQTTQSDRKMTNATTEEIKDKIAAAEARSDTKIVRLEGKIDTLAATIMGELSSIKAQIIEANTVNKTNRWVIISVMVACAFALAGLLVALSAYGDAMFSRGMSVRDVVADTVKELQKATVSKP